MFIFIRVARSDISCNFLVHNVMKMCLNFTNNHGKPSHFHFNFVFYLCALYKLLQNTEVLKSYHKFMDM